MLITKDDIPETEKSSDGSQEFGPGILTSGDVSMFLGKIGDSIESKICNINPDHTIFGATRGNWGTAEAIAEILKQIGPSECYLTSYSVKEQPIRNLLKIADQGLITKMGCLFDERIRVHSPKAYQLLASNVVEISLTKIHAKLAVLVNDKWGVTIVTSANLTRNPRVEFYVIDTHRENALAQRKWISDQINKCEPFTND